jgi:tryptophan 2,3-dioxygenase
VAQSVVLAEHFFVIAHQSCELWLKQIIADLDAATDALLPEHGGADAESSIELLQRSAELLRLLHEQLIVLEKLPARHFATFRPYLDSASGAQSEQFRFLANQLGSGRHPSRLYLAFTAAAEHDGTAVAEICQQGPAAGVYHQIVEAMLDIGNAYWRWQVSHLALISRMIGDRQGTGGTSGVPYLVGRMNMPFPELRRLRAQLHDDASQRTTG